MTSERYPIAVPLTEDHACGRSGFTICWHVTLTHPEHGTRVLAAHSDSSFGAHLRARDELGLDWTPVAVEVGRPPHDSE
jgi:hypothetical protein